MFNLINNLSGILLVILLYLPINVLCQNETNNWYFGEEAGLNFANGSVSILSNGAMSTIAGCSSISDKNGELLFYTNGQTVWNRNHEIMDNGNGLAGDTNNTQTSIIIPKPNSDERYYIFTTREFSSSSPLVPPGVYYSEIIISSTYPYGTVFTKNRRLTNSSTERITAVHHAETNTIKVIVFASKMASLDSPKDTFYVFNVTENGIELTPVQSTQIPTISSVGAMKISPSGKYIAVVDHGGRYIQMYKFNVQNSSIEYLYSINPDLPFGEFNPYGVEFSQDSKILYFTVKSKAINTSYLYKYILNDTGTLRTKILVHSSQEFEYGSLQLARNGKIYMANYSSEDPLSSLDYISVINDPESLTADSGFRPLAISLETGSSFKGLPNFISSFFRNRIIAEDKCENDIVNFSLDAYADIESVSWNFGDNNTSIMMNPEHIYTEPGEYSVIATMVINGNPIELFKTIEIFPLPIINSDERLMQCDVDNDGVSYFNLFTIEDKILNLNENYEFYFYNNYNDALAEDNEIVNPEIYENLSNPQEIYVNIVSSEGCSVITNFFIETTYTDIGSIDEIRICNESQDIFSEEKGVFNFRRKANEIRSQFGIPNSYTISFFESFIDAQTRNNPLPLYYLSPSTTVWTRIDSENSGCFGIESIELNVNPRLELNIEDNYIICYSNRESPIILDGGISNERWEWKNRETNEVISTSREFEVESAGRFSFTAYKTENGLECKVEKSFNVEITGESSFNEINTNNNTILVSVNGESSYEFSLDNLNFYGDGKTYLFSNITPGVYTVYVRDINNCETPFSTQVSFIGFPNYFTPNNDGYNDVWRVEGLSDGLYISADIIIFDRFGKILYSMDLESNNMGWDGTYNGKFLFSSNYWYKALLIDKDNNTFLKTGYFSMY